MTSVTHLLSVLAPRVIERAQLVHLAVRRNYRARYADHPEVHDIPTVPLQPLERLPGNLNLSQSQTLALMIFCSIKAVSPKAVLVWQRVARGIHNLPGEKDRDNTNNTVPLSCHRQIPIGFASTFRKERCRRKWRGQAEAAKRSPATNALATLGSVPAAGR